MIIPDKRLAIYLPTLAEGGAERVLLNLADGFARRGYLVDFVLAQCEGPFMEAVPGSVRLIELNPFRFKFGRALLSLPFLARYIRKENPEALLSGMYANLIAILAIRLAGASTRLVVSEHNTFSVQSQTLPFIIRKLKCWFVQHLYPLADMIVAVSKGVAEDLSVSAKITRDQICVIHNPIITPDLIKKAKEELNHPWFQPDEPPVILAIGRLTPQKDFPLLINAFARIRQLQHVRLLILGEGEERENLLSLIRELGIEGDVSMPGFVSNPYPYMSRGSVFVLSSRWEGLPTVLVEALYCGVPVVATDCPSGPREILAGGLYGKLVPVGDLEELTSAIQETINQKQTPPPPGSWMPYDLDRIVDQYLEIM